MARVGRRPGKRDTRGAILAAAREAFSEHGYEGASIRMIAEKAEVDPALIHHYFTTKDRLFLEAIRLPFDPDTLQEQVFCEGPEAVPRHLVRTFLTLWETPVVGQAMAGVMRTFVSQKAAAVLMREYFSRIVLHRILGRLHDHIPMEEIPLRAALVSTQLFGLALSRYILCIEPLASLDIETVVDYITPTIRRYLFEEI